MYVMFCFSQFLLLELKGSLELLYYKIFIIKSLILSSRLLYIKLLGVIFYHDVRIYNKYNIINLYSDDYRLNDSIITIQKMASVFNIIIN